MCLSFVKDTKNKQNSQRNAACIFSNRNWKTKIVKWINTQASSIDWYVVVLKLKFVCTTKMKIDTRIFLFFIYEISSSMQQVACVTNKC